tara:strand:+ start:2235 stop:2465 length:231 start_codon:yes stop_codon:yes gene_type:complete
MTEFEQKLLETLSDISGHLKDISSHTADVNIELEHLNEKDFAGEDYTSDIAKNIADTGLELSSKLTDIGCFVSSLS